ncbi:hypothetical protein IEQ34_008658 [Dendrobium chrysotoxum]|uniref:Uncharacterized protein n=1 Tax=Dendrobium chrysotoxum TaxID=161865 RepID=A0AAV7GZJ2_DENCH|nr:hypothetical protein IEQ34_008658 [Dendrobium chrysotoxum]
MIVLDRPGFRDIDLYKLFSRVIEDNGGRFMFKLTMMFGELILNACRKAKIQGLNGGIRDITDEQGCVAPVAPNAQDQSNIIVVQENSFGINPVVDILAPSTINMLGDSNVNDTMYSKGNIDNYGLLISSQLAMCKSSLIDNNINFLTNSNVEAIAGEPLGALLNISELKIPFMSLYFSFNINA